MADPLPNSPGDVLLAALRARDEHDHARITALCDPESVRAHFERYCDANQPRTREWFAKHSGLAQEYFTRAMARSDERWDLVRRLRKHGRAVPPELLGTPPGMEYVVLGGVHETPDLVHVLCRTVARRGQPDELRGSIVRTAVRRQPDGEWRLHDPKSRRATCAD